LLIVPAIYGSYLNNLNYKFQRNQGRVNTQIPKHRSFFTGTFNFNHGVASGDPTFDTVILWTKVTPSKAINQAICLDWMIAFDESMDLIVDQNCVFTSSEVDYTVKVEAQNLFPFTTYYYMFKICGTDEKSPIGRTKTIPEASLPVSRNLKFAIFSCSNYPSGFFNAYGNVARKDSVDYVIHLGDYIYESGSKHAVDESFIGRKPEPLRPCVTLYDYRTRLAQYHTDPDLQFAHQLFPWWVIWDDHDLADNSWKAGSAPHAENATGYAEFGSSFASRRANALQAFYEYVPIRLTSHVDTFRIWRVVPIGTLLDIFLLDTRHYDRDITDTYDNTHFIDAIADDESRSIMGQRQEEWLYEGLRESTALWKVIAQQVVFTQVNYSEIEFYNIPFDLDAWDGYRANRRRLLKVIYECIFVYFPD